MEQINSMHTQIKQLQDENRQLKHDISVQKANKIDSNGEVANKNLFAEFVSEITR